MLRLFISHSSKTDASLQLLHKICDKLQANDNGCYILVDKSGLKPTDDWAKKLHEWLAECHAAVILVSEEALESWWVYKEAMILQMRWQLDPNFKHLFIVPLGDLKEEAFTHEKYKVLNLKQVQFLTDHHDDPGRIVESIEMQLAELQPANTPFDRMRERISRDFSEVLPDTLVDVCRDLQVENALGETIKWSGSDNTPQAEALARLVLREYGASLRLYNDVLNTLNPPLHYDRAKSLYVAVYPLWVDEEAAALLPLSRLEDDLINRRITINGKRVKRFTAESFIRRAHRLELDWEFIPIADTNTDKESIIEAVRDHFRVIVTGDTAASAEDTDEDIRDYEWPIYILLPDSLTDETILDELQDYYPDAIFLLSVGENMPDKEAMPAKAKPIFPPVDIGLEKQQNIQMNRARSLLNKLPGAPRQ